MHFCLLLIAFLPIFNPAAYRPPDSYFYHIREEKVIKQSCFSTLAYPMRKIFINIKTLVQVRDQQVTYLAGKEMRSLPFIHNAFLLIDKSRILAFGSMEDQPALEVNEIIDCSGKIILPTWVDAHTHLVFAATREGEFVDRINGLSYQEIADKGGGILNSARRLQSMSEDDLLVAAKRRLNNIINLGTGAVEIKSGYGLTTEAELKMLRIINELRKESPIPLKSTYLAAHAVPLEYKDNKETYIDYVINNTLPKVAEENLADYIDVFCEKGYFDKSDTLKILEAGRRYNLVPKIHVNQFNAIGGVKIGVEQKALSVDHLEVLEDEDIVSLKNSDTMPVALPGCSYFLGIPYTPARRILDAGLPIALSSDYNPGSAPNPNMNFVVSAACIKMKMTPEEAINAATINSAYAMDVLDEVGSITVGKRANFIITKPITGYTYLCYAFGESHIESVYINGKIIGNN